MILCDKCGRPSTTTDWWLHAVGPEGRVVTRCPEHITAWALRSAGIQRSKRTWRWVAEARRRVPPAPAAIVPRGEL